MKILAIVLLVAIALGFVAVGYAVMNPTARARRR
jgi:hypothetical protein